MKLYGTTTSPYVRRVRAVAAELGVAYDLIDTAPDPGQSVLREVSPLRKVPVAQLDGRTIYDSRAIIDYLLVTRGYGPLEPPRDPWRDLNLRNAIDTAIDSMMQVFYLRRDGIAIDGTMFAVRQTERTDAIFDSLVAALAPDGRSFGYGFGLVELALVGALDWMDFREAYPTARAAKLEGVRTAWRDRPSLASTRPHV